jgi:hypothetical protein
VLLSSIWAPTNWTRAEGNWLSSSSAVPATLRGVVSASFSGHDRRRARRRTKRRRRLRSIEVELRPFRRMDRVRLRPLRDSARDSAGVSLRPRARDNSRV